jgi:dihydrodipicolinate synthase/N-acetylneuraminate lyase
VSGRRRPDSFLKSGGDGAGWFLDEWGTTMDIRPITSERLASSVIAVPPLARDGHERVLRDENVRLIRHIESGGVDVLLYGGNANFYHLRPSEYASVLGMLAEAAAPGTLVVPSAGPAYGVMMDQAEVAREFAFPTVMVLPHQGLNTYAGVETGLRRFAERLGRPIVVYVKQEGYVTPAEVARLVRDGCVSWIKYAIVRPQPAEDAFLKELLQQVPASLVVSGIGEQPAVVHLRDWKLNGFTSGCVCVAPALSMGFLRAATAGNWAEAERIRGLFKPLEDLRNAINPVRVLHEAVRLAGLADTGPVLPLLSGLTTEQAAQVEAAATALLLKDREWRAANG